MRDDSGMAYQMTKLRGEGGSEVQDSLRVPNSGLSYLDSWQWRQCWDNSPIVSDDEALQDKRRKNVSTITDADTPEPGICTKTMYPPPV